MENIKSLFSKDAQFNNMENFNIINVEYLIPFKNHPFKVNDDLRYHELKESIRENGIIFPIIIRKLQEENQFEILSGHRRVKAAKELEIKDVPVRILNVIDDIAKIIVVETNLTQREKILPSEKAWAYKMEVDALKHQGRRTDLINDIKNLTSCHYDTKLNSDTIESKKTIYRYIRLTHLIEPLLNLVDKNKLSLLVSNEFSYLNQEEQNIIFFIIAEKTSLKISLRQAKMLRTLSLGKNFDLKTVKNVLLNNTLKKESTIKKVILDVGTYFDKNDFLNDRKINEKNLKNIIISAVNEYLKNIDFNQNEK